MRLYAGSALIVTLALFETSALGSMPVFGVTPNLVLLVVIAWTLARGLNEALPLYAVAGLALGLLSSAPSGTSLLALTAVAALTIAYEQHILGSDLAVGLVIAGAGSLVFDATHLAASFAGGERVLWVDAALQVMIPAAAVNLALFPLFFWAARGLLPERERATGRAL